MTTADEAVPVVGPEDGHALVDAGAFLLDVREPDEWQAGHASAARFIPLGEVTARVSEIPTDQRVVVICRSGARSERATRFLRTMGIDAANLAGGMRAWSVAGLDVVTDAGAAGTVI